MLNNIRVNDIDLFVRVPRSTGSRHKFVNRKCDGILLVDYGKLCYECNGEKYFTDNTHPLFISRGSNYTLHGLEDSMTYVINMVISEHIESDTFYRFTSFPTSSVQNILSTMERAWTLQKPSSQYHLLSGLYEIIGRLNDQMSNHYLPQTKRAKILPSIEYIEKHFSDSDISNDLLASISGISTVYFRKIFFEIYQKSPMQYIHMLRMEKAKTLLESGYSSVGETAHLVGFNNIYHFSRTFKQAYGIAPSMYGKNRK